MTAAYLHMDAQVVKSAVARMLESYPDLAEDETLRADMVEGETDAFRIIERALAERREAETMADAIKAREADLAARRGRFERKADAMRALIRGIMTEAKLPKVQLTEATILFTSPPVRVDVLDLDALPQGFYRTKKEADKTALKKALMAGDQVPGAVLAFGDEGLQIRTK